VRRIAIDTNIYTSFKCNEQVVVETFRDCDLIGVDITVIAERTLFPPFLLLLVIFLLLDPKKSSKILSLPRLNCLHPPFSLRTMVRLVYPLSQT
jgi:hypothetical protein